MERKVLYEIGNLFTGRPYAVILTQVFGAYEVHGPFKSENDANTYAHDLAENMGAGEAVGVVEIDLLPVGGRKIVRSQFGLAYQPI